MRSGTVSRGRGGYFPRARVFAAFFAAADLPERPLVCAAFFAAAERLRALRRRAAERACFESARPEAVLRGSRSSLRFMARERFAEGFFLLPLCPFRYALSALLRVFLEVVPFLGGRSFTPARRAFDRPIAIACLVERAPCLPSRTW